MEAFALGLVPCLLVLSLVCLALFVIVRWERRRKMLGRADPAGVPVSEGPPGYQASVPPPQPALPHADLPYTRARVLLTDAERDFFAALCAAAPAGWHVFPQVRLANLVQVRQGTRNWRPHFSRIAAKCVDFVLCEPAELRPQLVVELDDSSHQRPDRQRRDAFVDAALGAAGVPILHVRWQRRYDVAQLAERICAAAGGSALPAPTPALPAPAQPGTPPTPPPGRPAIPMPKRWACAFCGASVGEAAKFCNDCGAPFEITR